MDHPPCPALIEKQASTQAEWAFLLEGIAQARVRAHNIRHLLYRAHQIIQQSDQKEAIYEVAGDIIQALPDQWDQLERLLDRVVYAALVFGEQDYRSHIPSTDRNVVRNVRHKAKPIHAVANRWLTASCLDVEEDEDSILEKEAHKRQRRQSPAKRRKDHQRYMRNRNRIKNRAKRRYRRVKNKAQFKRRRKLYRKNPNRFKRLPPGGRSASTLMSPDIPFVIGPDMELGVVRQVSPMTGAVTFSTRSRIESLPAMVFLNAAIFLTEDDLDDLIDLLSDEIGADAFADPTPEDVAQVARLLGVDIEAEDFKTRCFRLVGKRHLDNMTRKDLNLVLDGLASDFFMGEGKYAKFFVEPGRFKSAATIGEILAHTGKDVQDKAKGLQPKLVRADPGRGFWTFSVPGSKGQSYKVQVKGLKKGNTKSMGKAHVQVKCSCPFFQWQGPEHWAVVNKYLYGKPRGTATQPDVRDPEGTHWVCKHLVAVLRLVSHYHMASGEVGFSLDPGTVVHPDFKGA